jgi:hypothetical protein
VVLGEDIFGNAKSRLCYYVTVFLKTAVVACSDLDGRSVAHCFRLVIC